MDQDLVDLARSCREQARRSLDPWTSSTLLEMAADYEALAAVLGESEKAVAKQSAADRPIMFRK